MTDGPYPLTGLFLQGRARHAMSDHEKALVEGLVHETERYTAAHTILSRGDVLDRSTLLIEGFVARVIRDGDKRHIVAIHVPGDFVDLHAFALKRLDHDVVSIGTVKIGYVRHERLQEMMEEEPHLTRLLWFSTLLDASIHREWIMKLEQLSADGRLAHLMAELWQRLDFVGLAEPNGFSLPLTQTELADSCGTTAIHMNRVIRKLREDGIVNIARGRVTVLDHDRLVELGAFDPAYLYGEGPLKLS